MNSALILHDKEVGRSSPEVEYDFDEQWYEPVGQAIHDQTGADVAIPELPHPSKARFADYAEIIDGYKIDEDSTVIGHGFGAGVLLRYLSERKDIAPDQVALVAPSFLRSARDRKGEQYFRYLPNAELAQRIGKLSLLYSENTSASGLLSVQRIWQWSKEAGKETDMRTRVHRLRGFGNCMVGNSMKSPDFPELLGAVGPKTDKVTDERSDNVVSIFEAKSLRTVRGVGQIGLTEQRG